MMAHPFFTQASNPALFFAGMERRYFFNSGVIFYVLLKERYLW